MSATVLPAAGPQPLRRRPPQAAAGPHRATVRRNLFGPVDHEENLRFVHAELAKMAEADARRWNFDFARERPLAGRFAWERPARAWRTPAPKRQTAITEFLKIRKRLRSPSESESEAPECSSSSSNSSSPPLLKKKRAST